MTTQTNETFNPDTNEWEPNPSIKDWSVKAQESMAQAGERHIERLGRAVKDNPPVKKKKRKSPTKHTDLSGFDAKAIAFLKANPGWHTTQTMIENTYPQAHATSLTKKLVRLAEAGKVMNKRIGTAHAWKGLFHGDEMTQPGSLAADEKARRERSDAVYKDVAEAPKHSSSNPLFTISYYPDHAELSLSDAAKIVSALEGRNA